MMNGQKSLMRKRPTEVRDRDRDRDGEGLQTPIEHGFIIKTVEMPRGGSPEVLRRF